MTSRRLIIKQDCWLSLGAVYERLPELITAPRRRISDIRSALKLLERVVGRPLAELPADPEPVRQLFHSGAWQLHHVSKMRWANARSLIAGALYEIGVISIRSRQRIAFSDDWRQLTDRIQEDRIRHGLSRFLRWCSSHGIGPSHVTAESFERYARDLTDRSVITNPRERMHVARRTWNKAALEVPDWPQVHIPSLEDHRRYALPWTVFPERLQKDVADYRRRRSTPDLLDDMSRTIKPLTVKNHLDLLRRYATILVNDGVKPEALASLADLIHPDMARRGLVRLLGGATKPTPTATATASAICSIARYLGLPADEMEALSRFAGKLRAPVSGMTEKNKQRLGPLRDRATRAQLARLPAKIAAELVKSDKPTYAHATRMRFALAIEILQMAPMRVGNLARLDLNRHIGSLDENGELQISIPADEVKNEEPLEYVLPEPSARLLRLYRERFRPVLMDAPTTALFPSRIGGAMDSHALARVIGNSVKREIGLTLNAHLFRHMAATLYLENHPGDYETARRFLGHKSIQTTVAFYAGLEMEESVRRFDRIVLRMQNEDAL